MSAPLPIQNLRIIGYTGYLPESMRPGYLAPVFETEDGRILVAPYEIHEEFLSGAASIDRNRYDEFVDDGTIRSMDPRAALPDHWLWMHMDGALHYEPKSRAERSIKEIQISHVELAEILLRAGRAGEALAAAQIAFGAGADLEAYVILALCYERTGNADLAEESKIMAIRSGNRAAIFDALLESRRQACRAVPPTVGHAIKRRLPRSPEFDAFCSSPQNFRASSA